MPKIGAKFKKTGTVFMNIDDNSQSLLQQAAGGDSFALATLHELLVKQGKDAKIKDTIPHDFVKAFLREHGVEAGSGASASAR